MRRLGLAALLLLMCAPVGADVHWGVTTHWEFTFQEFSGPGDRYTVVLRQVETGDSTIVAEVEHVGDGRTYGPFEYQIGEDGLWEVRVWGVDVFGRVASCADTCAYLPPWTPGGCQCRPVTGP